MGAENRAGERNALRRSGTDRTSGRAPDLLDRDSPGSIDLAVFCIKALLKEASPGSRVGMNQRDKPEKFWEKVRDLLFCESSGVQLPRLRQGKRRAASRRGVKRL